MKIVFVCNSSYQIMIAAMMRRLEYPDAFTVLAMDAYFYDTMIHQCEPAGNPFFDRIVCLHDASLSEDVDRLLSIQPDKVHLFNWGNDCSRLVYNRCICPVEVTDEGIGSYQLQKMWNHRNVDLSRLEGIWLLVPEFSQDQELGIPIRRIRITDLFASEESRNLFLRQINCFYRYTPEVLPDIFYFDRYFVSGNMMPTSYEREMLLHLVPILSPYDWCIKIHPSESFKLAKYRYRGLDVRFFENTRTPWEVILLNHLSHRPLMLISVNSTPVILSKLIASALDVQVEAISLIDMVRDYVDPEERFIETLLESYNNSFHETAVHRVSALPQIAEILVNTAFLQPVHAVAPTAASEDLSEIQWLRQEYLWYSKTFGNLLDTTEISLWTADGSLLYSDYLFFAWRDRHVNLNFRVDALMTENACLLKLVFSKRGIVQRLENLRIETVHQGESHIQYNGSCEISQLELPVTDVFDGVNVQFDIGFPLLSYNYREYTI